MRLSAVLSRSGDREMMCAVLIVWAAAAAFGYLLIRGGTR